MTSFIACSVVAAMCLFAKPAAADSPLADAIERQQNAEIERRLMDGADLNAAQADGMTPLHWAIYRDDEKLALRLIEMGADIRAENRYGVNALAIACTNGNLPIVQRLLDEGADANFRLAGRETVLMTAARTGKVELVKALIAHGAEVDAKERKGQTALMWAAAEGNLDVVEALLEVGADHGVSLASGFTPLLFAIREGKTEVVRRLLEAGADVNAAIDAEKTTGRAPPNGMSPLLLAVENGHFDLAVMLLEAGADPNDQRSGFAPLHALSWVRKPDRGDDIESAPPPTGSGRMTSLEFARELVRHGADVDLPLNKGKAGKGILNRKGATPFLLAADTADLMLMKTLVELGADPHLGNADDCTPLMAAAGIGTIAPGEEAGTEEEALEAVKFLLERGGEINHVDQNGETAMHGAAYKSLPRMIEYLASQGADIEIWNRPNRYGWTPLKIAEGYRPGNFRPSAQTLAALVRVMKEAGVEPSFTKTVDPNLNNSDYLKPKP